MMDWGRRHVTLLGVVVAANAVAGSGAHATPYDFTTIDVPGSYYTTAYGINNAGTVVGSYNNASGAPDHGFLYSGGNFATIDVPGAYATQVLGINNAGQIVGAFYVSSSGTGTGFIGTGGSYATIDVPGSYYTTVYGINDVGQAVGSYNNASGAPDHGFCIAVATLPLSTFRGPMPPRCSASTMLARLSVLMKIATPIPEWAS
jgi:probable HAF family extracellular repeat protein